MWLPPELTRVYGGAVDELGATLGCQLSADHVPLLLHPHMPAAHRRLMAQHGRDVLDGVWATATASYRSVVAWRDGGRPVGLKLSLGAIISHIRRALREDQIVRAMMMTALFETIPRSHRSELGLDWFGDAGGVVETHSGHGWLLRRLPALPPDRWLMPMFSLISTRGDRPPRLVELICDDGRAAEDYVLEQLLEPYVEAAAYLLFVQGIQIEAHAQNTLLEMDAEDRATGRILLRDFSDTTVSIPLRLARGKPLPTDLAVPADTPFKLSTITADYYSNFWRPVLWRGYDAVERYGLWGFVWPLNVSLERYFARYDSDRVNRTYLELWQAQAERFLGVTPLFRETSLGIATDEAITYYLRHQDWQARGATGGHTLPEGVEPLLLEKRARRRGGPIYERLESAWGELFLLKGLPVFFRPAF